MQETKLKGFKAAKTKMRVHLYKHLLLKTIEYPLIPIHVLSKTTSNTVK